MKTTAFIVVLILALVTVGIAFGENDHNRTKALVESGKILPLNEIVATLSEDANNRVIEAELEDDGQYIYEIEILTSSGKIWEYKVDATNGKILEKEQED